MEFQAAEIIGGICWLNLASFIFPRHESVGNSRSYLKTGQGRVAIITLFVALETRLQMLEMDCAVRPAAISCKVAKDVHKMSLLVPLMESFASFFTQSGFFEAGNLTLWLTLYMAEELFIKGSKNFPKNPGHKFRTETLHTR